MSFKPSKYQQSIFDFVQNGTGNAVVDAVAGSGKTTTIVQALSLIPKNMSVCFLAFNKSIVKELKERVPSHVNVQTLHSLGWTAVNRAYNRPQLNARKMFEIVNVLVEEWKVQDDTIDREYIQRVLKLIDLLRADLCSDPQELEQLAIKHDVEVTNGECLKALQVVQQAKTDTTQFDFMDMLYVPSIDCKVSMFKYDWVFVDECQDLNKAQQAMIRKILKPTSRFVAVGDPHQCQPNGTQILMQDGTHKNIEDLKIGDSVVSYESKNHCAFRGLSNRYPVKINQITKRKVNETLIEIVTEDGKKSQYTFNHHCMVRFNDSSKEAYCLYLMQKENKFRVGISPLWSKRNDFVSYRARREKADKMWILSIVDTKREAFREEQYFSLKFQIPQGRDIRFPIWDKEKNNYHSKKHLFEIFACNIIPKYMDVAIFQDEVKTGYRKEHKPIFKKIETVFYKEYSGFVYSLDVDKYHTYVADGIVTHNCIYGFAGADINSFRNLTEFPNTIKLPLSVNYRCGKNIVTKAQKIVSHLEAFESAIEGEVREESSIKDIQDGDMVLCRNTAPLVQLCLEFISKGRKATVKGSDIGANLINLVKKSKSRNLGSVWNFLENELAKTYRKLSLRYPHESDQDLMEMPSYRLLSEKITVLQIIADQSETVTDSRTLISKIGQIFSEKVEGIMLSTIHKAKGLEADNVFIIEKNLMPSKYAKKAWQKEQEQNLIYVAYTRPKKLLGFVSDWSYNRDREIGLNRKFERRQEIAKEIDEQIPNQFKDENLEPESKDQVQDGVVDLTKIKGRKNQVKALLDVGVEIPETIADMIGTHPSYVRRLIKELTNN